MTDKSDVTEPIDYGMLPALIGYHIRLAQIAIFRDFVSSLDSHDITPTHFGTLIIIEANPGIKQADLAKAVQLDRSTIVSLIDRLEKNDLVARERVVSDRRTNALTLTARGTRLLEKLKPLVLEHEKRLVSGLSKPEQKQLLALLAKLVPDYVTIH